MLKVVEYLFLKAAELFKAKASSHNFLYPRERLLIPDLPPMQIYMP